MQLAAEVGLALHLSPPIRGQPGLPPHRRRPIPLRTLAGSQVAARLLSSPSPRPFSSAAASVHAGVHAHRVPYRLTVQQDMVM